MLYLCEMTVRRNANYLHAANIEEQILVQVLSKVRTQEIFTELSTTHAIDTSEGADNDYLNLIRLVTKKFIVLRIKKFCKDEALERSHGNSISRLRIFSGL